MDRLNHSFQVSSRTLPCKSSEFVPDFESPYNFASPQRKGQSENARKPGMRLKPGCPFWPKTMKMKKKRETSRDVQIRC